MRVLAFGTYDTRRHPRIGIVLEGLREHGDEVIEINEPLGVSTAERIAMAAHPLRTYRLVGVVVARWLTLIRRASRVRGVDFDAVVVGYLGEFDVFLARLLFLRRRRVVLDLMTTGFETARDRRVGGAVTHRVLSLLDRMAVASADLVLVDTPEHRDLLPEGAVGKAVVTPVGADAEWLAAGDAAPARPLSAGALSVVYFGAFTPLHGAQIVGAALALLDDRPDIRVTMVGTGQDHPEARRLAHRNPAVRWLDWVAPSELPELVAGHDVCLGIFGTTEKAFRVVPNKVYQGAAAGCAVVTSATTPQRRAFGDAARFVTPGDSDALAEALRELAADPALCHDLADRARERAATRFSPSHVVGALRERLAYDAPSRSRCRA